MNIKRYVYLGIYFIFFTAVPAHAGDYTLYGEGSHSCGDWISERKSDSWYGKGQWMLGVISAVGYYDVYNLKITDSNGFAVWIDNYCQQNPLKQFGDGVYALVKELSLKKH